MTDSTDQIQLAIFDWAGTTIDFGSCAPAAAFRKVFAAHGVEASDHAARAPMGLNKREHLVRMLQTETIAQQWLAANGKAWTEDDVSRLYEEFIPYQLQAIEESSKLVPGLNEVVQHLRQHNIRIGGTTGYFKAAAEATAAAAREQGFVPDANICADDVPEGRPAPWMIYEVMKQLTIYPARCVVKIGDTVADIEAGHNAGCWTVGVCDSSSSTGLSYEDFQQQTAAEQQERIASTMRVFKDVGSHFTIGSLEELPVVIQKINQRMAQGERP
ncbi:phosphonoacetaldehyde hydrolase [Bremerella cremea]|uniref:phosphonoacetaldehyde hydrolase n=1 Tax=Bremerella cremea TaxID=1031537 RepID=UPI0031E9F96A